MTLVINLRCLTFLLTGGGDGIGIGVLARKTKQRRTNVFSTIYGLNITTIHSFIHAYQFKTLSTGIGLFQLSVLIVWRENNCSIVMQLCLTVVVNEKASYSLLN